MRERHDVLQITGGQRARGGTVLWPRQSGTGGIHIEHLDDSLIERLDTHHLLDDALRLRHLLPLQDARLLAHERRKPRLVLPLHRAQLLGVRAAPRRERRIEDGVVQRVHRLRSPRVDVRLQRGGDASHRRVFDDHLRARVELVGVQPVLEYLRLVLVVLCEKIDQEEE